MDRRGADHLLGYEDAHRRLARRDDRVLRAGRRRGRAGELDDERAASVTLHDRAVLRRVLREPDPDRGAAFTRCEATIANTWGAGGPGNGLPNDSFSVRWSGSFTFPTGTSTFNATADDGVRLWVDGVLLIDKWIDQGATDVHGDENADGRRSHDQGRVLRERRRRNRDCNLDDAVNGWEVIRPVDSP